MLQTRASAEKIAGDGRATKKRTKNTKQDRKIAQIIYYICTMYENLGGLPFAADAHGCTRKKSLLQNE